MNKKNNGIFQVGLVILVASVFVAGLLVTKLNFNILEAAKSPAQKAAQLQAAADKHAANVAKQAVEAATEKTKAANASAVGSGTGCGGNGNCNSGYHCSSGSCVADSGGGGGGASIGCGGRGNCTSGYSCNKGVCYNDTSGKADPAWTDLVSSESGCTASTGGTWCTITDVSGANHSFCTSNLVSEGCNHTAVDLGYTVVTGCVGGTIINGRCVITGDAVNIYVCPIGTKNCSGNQYKVSSLPNCFCGVAQVDYSGGKSESYNGGCGCGSNSSVETNSSTSTPVPTSTPTSTPTPTPTPTCTPTSTSTPTGTPTATPTFTSTPTATPNWCNGTCGSNYNCQGGLFCFNGYCRNPDCPSQSSCGCPWSTSTPTPPPVLGATAPPVLPKTGSDDLWVVAGLIGIMGTGIFLFKKFKLV